MRDRDFAIEQLKSISIICIFSFCFLFLFYQKCSEDILLFKKVLISVIVSCLGIAMCFMIVFYVASICMSLFEKVKPEKILLNVKNNEDILEVHVLNSCVVSNKDFKDFINLETVVLNSPDIELEEETFFGLNNLKNIELPANLSVLEKNLFLSCSSLESIVLPKSITCIKKHCFYNCNSLKKIDFFGKHEVWEKLKEQCWKNDLPVGCIVTVSGNRWQLDKNHVFVKVGDSKK